MAGLGFAVWGLGLMGLKVYEIYEALVFIKSPSRILIAAILRFQVLRA